MMSTQDTENTVSTPRHTNPVPLIFLADARLYAGAKLTMIGIAALASGDPPRAVIVRSELARMLQFNSSSVRSWVSQLQAAGYITIEPGAPWDQPSIYTIYWARGGLGGDTE